MDVLLVSDIFGDGEHLDTLIKGLQGSADGLTCLAPYEDKVELASEQDAYRFFLQQCGHDAYAAKVSSALNTLSQPTLVIGFSAGGSAAWRALAEYSGDNVLALLAFYPGQIRHHLHLNPAVPSYLLFTDEAQFSVTEVMQALQGRVIQLWLPCKHGFMNKRSMGFDAKWKQRVWMGLEQVVAGKQPLQHWFDTLDSQLTFTGES